MRNHATKQSVARVIASCQLFSGLGSDQIERLASVSRATSFKPGQRIVTQNDPCPGVFIVEQGQVRVYRIGDASQEYVLHLIGPGQSFAEVAVFGNFHSPANADATKPTSCVLIPADPLRQAIDSDHRLCRGLLSGMAFWTRHFVGMLDNIVLNDATNRVVQFLGVLPCDESGNLRLPGTKKDVANHLNLTSETFSRVLRHLTDENIVAVPSLREIRVVDPDRMMKLAGGGEAALNRKPVRTQTLPNSQPDPR